jgi:hypothetical protein
MKKLVTKLLLVAGLSAGLATQMYALAITPTTGILNTTRWEGNDNSNLDATAIAAIVGVSPLTERLKVEGSSVSGQFASSYPNSNETDNGGIIDYLSGAAINDARIFLYVKDGNQIPAFYIFDISGWNGTEDITLSGFWANTQGAISHLAVLGGGGPRTQTGVPDGGTTLALLGLALAGLGVFRRYIA